MFDMRSFISAKQILFSSPPLGKVITSKNFAVKDDLELDFHPNYLKKCVSANMEWKEIKPCFIFNFVLTDEVPSYSTLPGSNSFCNTIWSHLLTIIGPSIHLSQHLVKQTIRSAEREPPLREAKV